MKAKDWKTTASTLIHVPQGNQQTMDSAQEESPFQQVIPNIPQQSLYPSVAALGTSVNTIIPPSIPFSRRVINDIKEQQRKTLEDIVEGTVRSTNTTLLLTQMNKTRKLASQV